MDVLSIVLLTISFILLIISIFLIIWLVETLNNINKNLSFLRIDANVMRTLLKKYLCEEDSEE